MESQWIDINERQPKPKHSWVLVYADGAMNCMLYEAGEWFNGIGDDVRYRFNINPAQVTHWMPLPAPPTIAPAPTPDELAAKAVADADAILARYRHFFFAPDGTPLV